MIVSVCGDICLRGTHAHGFSTTANVMQCLWKNLIKTKIKKINNSLKSTDHCCSGHFFFFKHLVSLQLFVRYRMLIERISKSSPQNSCTTYIWHSAGRWAVWSCPQTAHSLPLLNHNFPIRQCTQTERSTGKSSVTLNKIKKTLKLSWNESSANKLGD